MRHPGRAFRGIGTGIHPLQRRQPAKALADSIAAERATFDTRPSPSSAPTPGTSPKAEEAKRFAEIQERLKSLGKPKES